MVVEEAAAIGSVVAVVAGTGRVVVVAGTARAVVVVVALVAVAVARAVIGGGNPAGNRLSSGACAGAGHRRGLYTQRALYSPSVGKPSRPTG